MARAYVPALEASAFTTVTKIRELPLPGRALVEVGTNVTASSPVLSAELPGELTIIRVADRMGFEVEDVVRGMRVSVGDSVSTGQVLCSLRTFFGLFESTLLAPSDGTVEFFTDTNAHLGIRHPSNPFTVAAYVDGVATEVVEGKSVTIDAKGAFVQGIFGVGGERQGRIFPLGVPRDSVISPATLEAVASEVEGAVLVGGSHYTAEALAYAATLGVAAVVCGSIDSQTLSSFVGYEIGVSITGDETVPFTLIITEGFGSLEISKRVMELAETFAGCNASVNGATQVRAGATRPEIIVPHDGSINGSKLPSAPAEKLLEVGARLRIIRVPYFGELGSVTELPSEPEKIPTGAYVRVLRAVLDTGEEVVVPRANVELL